MLSKKLNQNSFSSYMMTSYKDDRVKISTDK